jgi:hypothetical protein
MREAELMSLLAKVDALLHRAEHEEYTDDPVDWGRIGALNEVRTLVVAHRDRGEELAQDLARALGLVHPGPHSLEELVKQVVVRLEVADRERRNTFRDWW